jgi:ketosteroid isomerase-like protein
MTQTTQRTMQELEALGQRWAAAELRGDTGFLETFITDDFMLIGPLGFMLNKEQWLTRFTSNDLRYDSFAWDDVRVRAYGDAAIVTGRQTQTGAYKETHDIRGEFRVTQVFVRQDERWLMAGIHLSPIAPPPPQPRL